MKIEDVGKAKMLADEIAELESFIHVASQVWTGKLVNRTQQMLFRSMPYGAYAEREYFMNTEIKNKVLKVLEEHLKELRKELEQI